MNEQVLNEALETRKFSPGEVTFARSELSDPHIQRVIDSITAAVPKLTRQVVEKEIATRLAKFAPLIEKAPVLYGTIKDNIVEDQVYTLFGEIPGRLPDSTAPEFKERTFFKLVRMIAAEHDEFWPLRSYIDGRKLQPRFEFIGGANSSTNPAYADITTAAATPDGVFIFNVDFMQKLIDYAALKEIHPKGKKYESNGGDIPDGYSYIEFLILHEFMHYTNDDFHYQKVIPNANPTIINWVGDFRSNYLLVKSGYEQLPMGLYNDAINYDRQKTYIEMYNLVKAEMDNVKKDDPDLSKALEDALNGMGDDHKPGQEQGKSQSADGMTEDDIDKAGKRSEDEMKDGQDMTPDEAQSKQNGSGDKKSDKPGTSGTNGKQGIDYKSIKPAFNWKTLVGKMISKATVKMEETYSKPSRRSVSSLEVARQVGAAAIKPGEKQEEFAQIKLAFCIDSSGSMGGVISTVMANVANLLRASKFAKAECVIIKFSSSADMFKVNFYRNQAAKVTSHTEKVKQYNLTADDVLNVHFGAGTDLSGDITAKIEALLKDKWNVVLISDSDVTQGSNLKELLKMLKAGPTNMFVIFDGASSYQKFRQKAGISTPNITYFQ